ncbi:MAG: methyltransferase [Thermodesulfobacteriota bacterium]
MAAEKVMAEARNFMMSRVILTAAELDLFTRLSKGPASAEALAKDLDLDLKGLTRLLDALVVAGLLAKEEGVYRNTDQGVFLTAGHPETALPMVLHMNTLWSTWSVLTEVVRKGQGKQQIKAGIRFDEKAMTAFIGAMHVGARGMAAQIAETVDLSPYKKVLDVGGASGTYTIAFLRENPNLRAVLFDQKNVIPIARERLQQEGLETRVDLVPGDFYKDELPGGCDLALLSAIIHQNSPDENLMLFQKVFRALAPGGVILIRDHIMDESRTRPPAGAVFALNMLVNTGGGDTYTLSEVKTGLEKAGFIEVGLLKDGQRMDGLVTARKPNRSQP